jgi:hypothetical protein
VDRQEAEEWRSAACFAVEERVWKDLVPALTDDVIDMLAPPVVVSASAYRAEVPAQPARR